MLWEFLNQKFEDYNNGLRQAIHYQACNHLQIKGIKNCSEVSSQQEQNLQINLKNEGGIEDIKLNSSSKCFSHY